MGFEGSRWGRWTGHCEGAAELLKSRGIRASQDMFEHSVVLSVWGAVVSHQAHTDSVATDRPDKVTRGLIQRPCEHHFRGLDEARSGSSKRR